MKPGDIVTHKLTGERLFVLWKEDMAGYGDQLNVRREDLTQIQVYPFEVEVISA